MTRKTSAIALAVLAVAGCSLTTDLPPLKPISIVTMRSNVNSGSPTGFTGKAYAYFFSERGFTYSDSRQATNSCVGPQTIVGGTTPTRWLDPGQPTTFTLAGTSAQARTQQLVKGVASGTDANVYTHFTEPTLYPGNDSATITVAGAAGGFPAIQVSAKTVADFTFDPVADSGSLTGGLPVHWSASPNTNTAMEIALLYKSDVAQQNLNVQVVCTVVDDGDFSISRQYLDGWQRAGDDANPLPRLVRMTRFLSGAATAGDASILLLTSLEHTQEK